MTRPGEGKRKVADQIATVIDRTNYLEYLMSGILGKCLSPANPHYEYLLERVLHNSVTSFGAKVTVLMALLEKNRWKDLHKCAGIIHEVLRLRNAFAHTPTNLRRIMSIIYPDGTSKVVSSQMIIESKSSNTLKSITRAEGVIQFNHAYEKAKMVLEDIIRKIEETRT